MDLKDRIKKELARELAAVNFNEGQKAQLAKILLECQVKQKRSPLLSFLKRLWHGSTEIPISWGLVCVGLVGMVLWKSYAPILFVDQSMAAFLLRGSEISIQEIKAGISIL